MLSSENLKDALIVEDSADSALLLKYRLTGEGVNVKVVNTGKEAIEFVHENSPDIIFMDLSLPDISGAEVAKQIQKYVRIPPRFVMLSGYEKEFVEKELDGLEVFEIFRKPVATKDLRRSIKIHQAMSS